MRAWFSRSDFTSAMISSLSFLYLRSCDGDRLSLFRRSSMSWSCRRRSFLKRVGDGVEGLDDLRLELGFDRGERERALHVVFVEIALGGGLGRILLLAVALSAVLNGVAAGGADGGAGVCTTWRCGAPGTGVPTCEPGIGLPSGPICGGCMFLASGPA